MGARLTCTLELAADGCDHVTVKVSGTQPAEWDKVPDYVRDLLARKMVAMMAPSVDARREIERLKKLVAGGDGIKPADPVRFPSHTPHVQAPVSFRPRVSDNSPDEIDDGPATPKKGKR